MKKWIFLLCLIGFFTSCTEDVKFNNPAFQTLKDKDFWRAQTYKAHLETNGTVVIEGSLGYENVILKTASSEEGTYVLGNNDVSKGIYTNTLPSAAVSFSTGTNSGSGQIIITELNTANNTISGTFRFTAVNEDQTNTEKPSINFTEGVFYKVPIQ
ncbi:MULTISPECIES: DUF6252 family protein [Flavobacterium]|uniref:Lipoprotein n=1 Tax=Flavobacterium endoglycinae TaxID=2816357 RepID=A0ABX7QIW2_9FLAO|nr:MULTISPECIES: DUF6252 family protein [Flavobacterium]QSW91025.1 hypothetical protein J0383_09515 [Flavobacterium endoglycinae]